MYLFRALLLSPPNLLLVLLVIVNSPCYHSPFLLHPNPSPFLPHLPNSLLPSTLPLISPSFLRQTSVVNFIFHFFIQRKYVFIMFWIEEYNKIIFSLYFFTKQKKIHNKNIIRVVCLNKDHKSYFCCVFIFVLKIHNRNVIVYLNKDHNKIMFP